MVCFFYYLKLFRLCGIFFCFLFSILLTENTLFLIIVYHDVLIEIVKVPVLFICLFYYFSDENDNIADIFEENESEDEIEIYRNIKLQKSLIEHVRFQPWSMAKKLKVTR